MKLYASLYAFKEFITNEKSHFLGQNVDEKFHTFLSITKKRLDRSSRKLINVLACLTDLHHFRHGFFEKLYNFLTFHTFLLTLKKRLGRSSRKTNERKCLSRFNRRRRFWKKSTKGQILDHIHTHILIPIL